MAGQTLYYLDPASPFSKDLWARGAYEQLEDTPGQLFNLLDQLEPDRVEGRNYFFKLDIGDSLGQGMITPQGGPFPAPEDSEWDEAKITLARLAHTASLTMDEWELLNSDAAAAVPVVGHKVEKATRKMIRELSRQTHMDGSAILARCAATTASNTINLQTSASNQYDRDRGNWLDVNRALVDIIDTTDGSALASRRRIVDVDDDYTTVTIDGAPVTTTTDHVLTWAGSVEDFSAGTYVSGEMVGLGQLMKRNRTWMGINSSQAGKSFWDPVVVQGSTPGTPEAINISRIQKLYIAMSKRAHDGMEPGPATGHVLFSSHEVAAHAIATLVDQIRYMPPSQDPGPMDFGFREIEGLGIRWFTDVHYAHNVLDCLRVQGEYGINFARPANPINGPLDFVTTGSGDMWHLQPNADGRHNTAFNAYLTGLFGLCCKKPSENGRLDDITEP